MAPGLWMFIAVTGMVASSAWETHLDDFITPELLQGDPESCNGDENEAQCGLSLRSLRANKQRMEEALVPSHETFELRYHHNFCVSVDHNRFENGAKLQLYECLNGDGQFWEFPTANDPTFENFWVTPGYAKEFCAAIEGDRNYNGAKLQLQRCDPNNLAHQWFERRHTSPRDWDVGTKVSFANAKYSDKCFVVDGNKAKNLQRLQIWSCDHSDSQAFIVN